jgi:hypothetical protein
LVEQFPFQADQVVVGHNLMYMVFGGVQARALSGLHHKHLQRVDFLSRPIRVFFSFASEHGRQTEDDVKKQAISVHI